MIAAMAVIAFKPKPSRPPPRGTAGALGWLHANLFNSWWNTILTLLGGYLLARGLLVVYDWGIANAVWEASSRRECLDTNARGACWAGVREWFDSFLYGRYPASQRWRVDLSFALLALWLTPLWIPRVQAKPTVVIGAAVVFPFLAAYLLSGGERGWFMQVAVPLALVIFALNWLHVVLCLATGRSLASWLYRLFGVERKSERAHRLVVATICAVLTAAAGT